MNNDIEELISSIGSQLSIKSETSVKDVKRKNNVRYLILLNTIDFLPKYF